MGHKVHIGLEFEVVTCGVEGCGCVFALPSKMHVKLKDAGGDFWCPRGHKIFYTETRVQRLERQLKSEEKAREANEAWLRRRIVRAEADAESAKRSRNAYKGLFGRTKKRVAAGVCPCCNRTFENLARHMAGEHPGYAGKDAEGGREKPA